MDFVEVMFFTLIRYCEFGKLSRTIFAGFAKSRDFLEDPADRGNRLLPAEPVGFLQVPQQRGTGIEPYGVSALLALEIHSGGHR